jgi:hypothetical protein
MNKLLATMAAATAVALASPAAAQYGSQRYPNNNNQQGQYRPGGNADANIAMRIDQLQVRLQAGVQNGSISRQEAVALRQQLRQLTQLQRQYARDGISGQERGELQRRMRDLRQAIRSADGNSQASWDAYNREDGYGRDDGYRPDVSARIDANRDGYDDRDYNRNGRWDDDANDGRYAQPVPQQQPSRGGLGGIVDSLLGRGGSGGLQVGQRVTSGLFGLPDGYRDQYRDNNASYFRTDGRQIYQIDVRTQTVVRVYPMNR